MTGVLPTEVKYNQEDYKKLIENQEQTELKLSAAEQNLGLAQKLFENIHNALNETFDVIGNMPQDRPFKIVVESPKTEGSKPILRYE